MSKKAEMGIGTLIIFIAMILVAAIAAGVLIQTATSLQNKALLAGSRTKGQVSTAMSFLLVYAENGSTPDKTVNRFFFKTKLAPGSDPIKFEDSLVEFDLQDSSADLTFNMSNGTCADWEYDTDASGSGNFSVQYLVTGSEWKEGYLHRGDVVKICMKAPRDVAADEDIQVRFVPKIGTPAILETAIPDVITQQRIYIFP
ncbi:MAG: archaellin/type IV pilin N-terminal domain-containing protein [Nanoarchaeota archaeon]